MLGGVVHGEPIPQPIAGASPPKCWTTALVPTSDSDNSRYADLKLKADRRKLVREKPIFHHKAPAQGAFYVSSLLRTSPDRNNPTDKEKTMRTDSDSLTQILTADTISKWPSHLVIVRHAESERNIWKEIATAKGELVYGDNVRDMDVPLTPYGERQAVATGESLVVEHKFDRVFVSPFKRTMETAGLMIGQFPYAVEVIEDERLREIDFGVLDGLTKHGIADFHPEENERRAKLGKYHHRPPAGENYPDVALRLHSFLGTLTRE